MRRWQLVFLTLLGLVWQVSRSAPPGVGPRSPADEQRSFQLADPELVIELVAAEPDVISPVAAAWDEHGRLFVAEMRDYPQAATGGTIRLLEDRDGDGRYERSTVFADGLPFPNGVLPWQGGILVTAAPNIWFLKDTDGDGKADERRVVLTGFGEGNQQLRVNGLLWGLDNWVYGANGRSDGAVRRPNEPTDRAVSIRRHDFRFQPAGGSVEAVAGFSQFGLARDDWDRRFPSWNTVPMRHVVLEERYLTRNPALADTSTVAAILDPADPGRVYPISPPPQTFNREPTRFFNASCGLTIYRGDRLGDAYAGNALVCEPLTNLVHRRSLTPAGPTWLARRTEQDKEFLAATDPWFHPVNLTTGPDGCLYIMDFYRQWVEHPQFVAEKLRPTVDFRTGFQHGRIWRVRHKRQPPASPAALVRPGRLASADLVALLGQPNGWLRDTAQRLLVEKQDIAIVPQLNEAVRRARSPLARVHALWTLQGLRQLKDEEVLLALKDADPRVREQALRLAEGRANALSKAILAVAEDADDRVCFQCALVLGDIKSEAALRPLRGIAERHADDPWFRLAILSGLGERPLPFLEMLLADRPQWLLTPTADQNLLLSQVAALVGARQRDDEVGALLKLALAQPVAARPGALGLLAGLGEGLARRGGGLHLLLRQPPRTLADAFQTLERSLPDLAAAARSDKAALALRILALQVLVQTRAGTVDQLLLELLGPMQPAALQSAASRGLATLATRELAGKVLERWAELTIDTRREVVTALLRTPEAVAPLLDAIEGGKLGTAELEPAVREALLRSPDAASRKRAQALWKQQSGLDRQSVVRDYESALQRSGDSGKGLELFTKHCQTCHRLQGQGHQVGPDLSAVSGRSKQLLLVDILDPSQEVPPDYMSYFLVTTRGQVLSGLLAGETAGSVRLRRAGGIEDTVLRSEIQELRSSGRSLMPEGFEQTLKPQDIADLLEFLHRSGR